MTPDIIIPALASGAIIGVFLGAFGGGGSVLAVPLLLYLVGIQDPHLAIGTSAAAVAAIALFNLFGHWRVGAIKWPCALMFGGAGFVGSLIGSTIAKMVDGEKLLLGFAVAMAAIGLSMLRKPKSEGNADVRLNGRLALRLIPLGLLVGLAAGFFGIGGGFLIVPGLMLAAGMTLSNATASSLVSVVVFGAATSANYALSGWVDFRLTGLLLLAGFAGGMIGIWLSRILKPKALLARRLFAGMIISVAGYVAWMGV